MSAFTQLLRKDWRLNRAPVIALAITIVAPYLIAVYTYACDVHDFNTNPFSLSTPPRFAVYAVMAAGSGIGLATVTAAAFGANAIATERRERWADFLGAIPLSRRRIILSKLAVALSCLLITYAVHWTIIMAALIKVPLIGAEEFLNAFQKYSIVGIATFGVAWCLSTFLNSAAISAVLSLTLTLLGGGLFLGVQAYLSASLRIMVFIAMLITPLIAGTVYYARRVAP